MRRWLTRAAIKPWQHRSWIFPRDPDFETKAARVLDLYARTWHGAELGPDDYVISADEKSQLQALRRRHPGRPPGPGHTRQVEFEYRRGGTLAYFAAYDVHHARVIGTIAPKTGIEPFTELVAKVMTSEPYASARRVFWVVDNGSSHAGQASIDRMEHGLAHRDPGAPADPRLLAQPGRDLLLGPATQGHQPGRLRRSRRPRRHASWPSRTATTGPRPRSTGPSPAPTSAPCSTGSAHPSKPPRSRPPRDPRRTNELDH